MLRPTGARSTMPLQSRNTPSKDAPPQPAADDPPRKPREWLPPPFKEEFLASNDKPLLQKKEDTATTSMVNREALTGPSSVSLASCTASVSGALLASLSSRINASASTLPIAFPAGAEETSVVVAAVARKESKIPRQKSASPAKRRSPRLLPVRLPTCSASSPL